MERMKPSPAERMPQVLLAAATGRSLTGLDVVLQGVAPEELCHPLTKEQLHAVRSCTSFSRQDVEVTPVPNGREEAEGLLTFRVQYAIDGFDADGNAVSVHAEGVIGLLCELQGGAPYREVVAIRDVEHCRLTASGRVKRPGWLERRLRRWLRQKRGESMGEIVGEGLLEVLGLLLEFALEAIFDG